MTVFFALRTRSCRATKERVPKKHLSGLIITVKYNETIGGLHSIFCSEEYLRSYLFTCWDNFSVGPGLFPSHCR